MTACRMRSTGDGFVCPSCGNTLPKRGGRVPECGKPQPRREAGEEIDFSTKIDEEPCDHLGEVLREERCQLCGQKNKMAEVRSCSVHGECTVHSHGIRGTDLQLLQRCIICPERKYSPPSPVGPQGEPEPAA